MKSIYDLSNTLRSSASRRGVTQAELKSEAGISQRTLTNVLSGTEDYKVSTLMAVADRLGLELVLVPKAAAVAVEAGKTTEPRVKSRVAAALERVKSPDPARVATWSERDKRVESGIRYASSPSNRTKK